MPLLKDPLAARRWCNCLSVLAPAPAARDLRDELVELARTPSLDELSDVAFALGRLTGAFTKRRFVNLGYSTRHVEKIAARMQEHGCVRSARHLRDGRCPST